MFADRVGTAKFFRVDLALHLNFKTFSSLMIHKQAYLIQFVSVQ